MSRWRLALLLFYQASALYLPWSPEYTIGAGINSATLETKSSRCIRNLRVVEDPPERTGQKTVFQFTGVEDTESLHQEMSFLITGKKGDASFHQSVHTAMALSSYEAAFVLSMTVELGGAKRLDEDEAEWVSVLNKRDGRRLLKLCGDSFVERVETGGVLYAVIKTSKSVFSKNHVSRTVTRAAGWGSSVEATLQAAFSDTSRSDRTDVTVFQIGGNSSAWERGHVWNLDGLKDRVQHFGLAVQNHPWPFRVLIRPWQSYFPGYRPLHPIDLSGLRMQLETLSLYEVRLLEIQADVEYIQANIHLFAGVDAECLEDTKVLAKYGLHIVHREEWRALHDITHTVDPAVKFLIPDDTCLPEKPVGEQYLGCYHTKQIKPLSEYWSRADLQGGAFRHCANLANKRGQRFFGLGGGTSISRFTVGRILCFTLPANISRENLTEPQYGYGVCGSECPNETSMWCGQASRSVRQKVALYHRDLPEAKWKPVSARQHAREKPERVPVDESFEVPDGFEDDSFDQSFDFSDAADSPLPDIKLQRPDGSRYRLCRGPNCRHPSNTDAAPPDIADQTRLEPSDGPWDQAMSNFDEGTRPTVTIHRSFSPAALCRWSFFPLGLLLAS